MQLSSIPSRNWSSENNLGPEKFLDYLLAQGMQEKFCFDLIKSAASIAEKTYLQDICLNCQKGDLSTGQVQKIADNWAMSI